MMTVAIFVCVLFLYALLSQWIERTPLTAPITFTALGMVMSSRWAQIAGAGVTSAVFLRLAEVGLVLLLFTDSSRTDLRVLRSIGMIGITN